jgi:hypothetical protein
MRFFIFEAKIIVEILVIFKITRKEQRAEDNTEPNGGLEKEMQELYNDDIRNYYGICKLDVSCSVTTCVTNMARK